MWSSAWQKKISGLILVLRELTNSVLPWLNIFGDFKNIKKHAYTFFSSRQPKSYPGIDMIWALMDLLLDTYNAEILPKVFANDNPLYWTL